MRIVVTGADGFIGRHLVWRLTELGYADVERITERTSEQAQEEMLRGADVVYLLSPPGNPGLLTSARTSAHLVYVSAIQRRAAPSAPGYAPAETDADRPGAAAGARQHVFHLVNVFGKWSDPGADSIVSSICYNEVHGIPQDRSDPDVPLSLLYVDDAVAALTAVLGDSQATAVAQVADAEFHTSRGEVLALVASFAESRQSLLIPPVGTGLARALYSTYLSYLPPDQFTYDLPRHSDARGSFVEVLKTANSGQFSYFTAGPGVTRGGHYHHTKTEKFLVVRGAARFSFRHIETGERVDLTVDDSKPTVVETVPGWAHDITNIGTTEMIVMLWANEIFDPTRPDTTSASVSS